MTSDPGNLAIEAMGITYHYSNGAESLRVLDSVDLSVARGEFIALVGPSGCG